LSSRKLRPYILRFLKIFFVSLVVIFTISEVSFRVLKFNIDRGPERIEMVIPLGTAAKVASGEEAPGIPDEMIFVLGDVLVVFNEDVVTHELGPLLIPAGASASFPMDAAETLALSCSFTSGKYLGVDVREPTDWETRLLAMFFSVPPTATLIFLYSMAVKPVDTGKKD